MVGSWHACSVREVGTIPRQELESTGNPRYSFGQGCIWKEQGSLSASRPCRITWSMHENHLCIMTAGWGWGCCPQWPLRGQSDSHGSLWSGAAQKLKLRPRRRASFLPKVRAIIITTRKKGKSLISWWVDARYNAGVQGRTLLSMDVGGADDSVLGRNLAGAETRRGRPRCSLRRRWRTWWVQRRHLVVTHLRRRTVLRRHDLPVGWLISANFPGPQQKWLLEWLPSFLRRALQDVRKITFVLKRGRDGGLSSSVRRTQRLITAVVLVCFWVGRTDRAFLFLGRFQGFLRRFQGFFGRKYFGMWGWGCRFGFVLCCE